MKRTEQTRTNGPVAKHKYNKLPFCGIQRLCRYHTSASFECNFLPQATKAKLGLFGMARIRSQTHLTRCVARVFALSLIDPTSSNVQASNGMSCVSTHRRVRPTLMVPRLAVSTESVSSSESVVPYSCLALYFVNMLK